MTETRAPYRVRATKPQQSEAELQAAARQLLSLEGILYYEFAPPNSRAHCPKCGAVVGNLAGAVPVGFPDMLVILPSVVVQRGVATTLRWRDEPVYLHLELKSARGKPSKEQPARRMEIQAVGGHWHAPRTIEDIALILRAHGHTMRAGGDW